MSNVQMTDCKAMEAQSLEQARRAADPDLRHLYETIAGQWHLLAEVGQMRHLNAALGCPPNGRGVLISGRAGSVDQGPESLDDQRPNTDSGIAQVSADPGPESLGEQQPLNIEGVIAQFPETNQAAQVGVDRETESLDDQRPDTDSGIAQVSTDPKTNQASKVGADRGTERLDGSASGTDGSKPSERRIESPLEWILSYWFKGHHH